jgi:phosphatidylglycerophosphatase A
VNRPKIGLVTVFGLGYMRPASGTWGSLPPVIIALAVWALTADDVGWSLTRGPEGPGWWLYHIVLAAIFLVFSAACIVQGAAAEYKFLGKDPSNAVADETAGQCLPLMFLPFGKLTEPWLVLAAFVLAFLAFRAMDILKPWPARGLQSLPGGWGVLVDDLFAGFYAALIVQLLTRTLF